MLEYIKLVVELYKKELQQDGELLQELVQEWILIPRDISMHTYMAMYGIFGCIIRILILLFIRIPVWWPMHMLAYLINCIVRYSFVPLFAWLHIQLNQANKGSKAQRMYSYLYTVVEWIEWILKTVFLFTYVVNKIVTWVRNRRSVREYINYKIDQIVVKAHVLRNKKQKTGSLSKLLIMVKQWWITYMSPVPRLIWQGIKIIYKYINPLNYTWVKYVVYAKKRNLLIIVVKCRVIIRFAIWKGLFKYGVQGWLYVRLCRWGRNAIHLFKIIGIKYYPKLALLNMSYWLAFNSWWIVTLVYRYMRYTYIYFIGGLKWLLLCTAILSSPILYILLQLVYVFSGIKIWYIHGIWISRSYFYLMVGWNTSSTWLYTRIK